jgi:hypothetical protein
MAVFLYDEMTLFFDWLTIDPPNRAPTKLSEHGVVSVPCFEVQSTPDADFLGPECTNAFKDFATGIQHRVCSFQTLVVLLDLLEGSRCDQK